MTSHAKHKTLLPGKKRISPSRKMDLSKALILRAKGNSFKDIAPLVGLKSGQAVSRSISNFLDAIPSDEQITLLDKLKINSLKGTLGRMIVGLNSEDKIENASLNNVAYALTQVNQALRLEQDKSTTNVAYADALSQLKRAKEDLKKLNDSNTSEADVVPEQPYTIPVVTQS